MSKVTESSRALERKMNYGAWVLSAVVLVLVVLMRKYTIPSPIDFSFLPPIHASLNALCAIVLVIAFYFIKKKRVEAHRKSIYVALVLSVLFLLSYVLYHFTTPETGFCKEGPIRIVYFILLISHIVLAGLTLPFILLTFNRAFTGHYHRHKRMARWVFPLWLYVAITGPICYLMLYPCY